MRFHYALSPDALAGIKKRPGGVYSDVISLAKIAAVLVVPAVLPAQVPDDVLFELKVARDPPIFKIDERIEIELRFSTKATGKYRITNSSADRSSLMVETYSVSPPEGAVDPKTNSPVLGFAGSFMSAIDPLTDTPMLLHADLNEWFHFTKPGDYVVTATSPRISLQDSEETPIFDKNPTTVRSTPLRLTIVGVDAEWLDDQVREIAAILDSDADLDAKMRAARRLSFIDTDAAASEMARRYLASQDSDSYRGVLHEGLSQTPFPKIVVPILEASIEDPERTARDDVIYLLARIVTSEEFSGKLPPPTEQGEPPSKAMMNAVADYSKRYDELVAEYTKRLMAGLSRRSGKARASAVYAAWEHQEAYFNPDKDMPSTELARLRGEVVAGVRDLDPNQQQLLLDQYWPRLPNASLHDFVRDLAIEEIASTPYQREHAFKRWCEFAESDCEATLIAEMRKPTTDLLVSTLLLLPAKEHPELDEVFAAHLDSNQQQAAALVARYGSSGMAPAVRKALKTNFCPAKENLLAYQLRVEPDEGIKAVAAALEQSNCSQQLLESIAHIYYTESLGKLAEEAVRENTNPVIVGDAATVLSEFGSASAEQVLWDRFDSWSEAWRDRAVELRSNQQEQILESQIACAIAQGKAWKPSPADFGRLEQLCVSRSCRSMVENWQTSRNQ